MNRFLQQCAGLIALACVSFAPIAGYAAGDARKGRFVQAQQQKPKPTLTAAQMAYKKKILNQKGGKHSPSSTSSASCDETHWDYVIVGGGTSGCALAAKLSDPDSHGKFKHSVLVLEAGENLSDSPLVLVNNIFSAIANGNSPALSTVNLTYYLENDPFDVFPYIQGRMWGGCAGHNYLLAVRGVPSVYDQWASISGDARWSYNQLLNNVMLPMEHYTPDGTTADPSQRGLNGPLFITQTPPLDTSDLFLNAVVSATGTQFTTDYNNPALGDVGVSALQQYVTPPFLGPNSHRSFAANAYLTGDASVGTPAIVDANGNGLHGRKLKIVSNARANKVLFSKGNKATGVEYVLSPNHEKVHVVNAHKKVILCTGTFEDAAILQRSGVGDPTLLGSLDIPVVFANPNVGSNMQTHVAQLALIGDATLPVNLPNYVVSYYGFAPNNDTREYQSLILNGNNLPAGISQAIGVAPNEGITITGLNVTPHSTGTVAIISRDPFIDPVINLNLFSDGGVNDAGSDANKAILFYNLVQDIASEAGGVVLFPTPDDYANAPEALFADALNAIEINEHACGSCRMAANSATGVVDGKLHVFGVKDLMVASNSVVPVINTGNTSYTADVIGREAARIIRGS